MIVPVDQESEQLQGEQMQKSNEYDEFKRPPNINLAIRHGLATQFAIPDPTVDFDQTNTCPCCGQPTIVNKLPITASIKDFSFNGPGVSLYFDFLIFSMLFSSIFIIIGGIYNISSNSIENRCFLIRESGQQCIENFYNRFSKSNSNFKEVDYVGSVLNFVTTLMLIIGLFLYRKRVNKLANEIDENSVLAQDFSIIVENLPRDADEAEIRKYFSNVDEKELQIKKVCLGYRIEEYITLGKEKVEQEKTLTRLMEFERSGKLPPTKLPKKDDLMASIKQISVKLDKLEETLTTSFEFSGTCIISYNTEEEANFVCKFYKSSRIEILFHNFRKLLGIQDVRMFRNNLVRVQKAPEPGDVLWENLGTTVFEQYKRMFLTNVASILLLFICFGILFGLSYGQFSISGSNRATKSQSEIIFITLLGVVASVLISAINTTLALIIRKLAEAEKHSTRTEYDISVAKKLGIAQFLNTAIITLIVNLVIVEQGESAIVSVVKAGGLNADVMLIFISNAIMPWLMAILDFGYFMKLYLRYKIKKEGENCLLTQQQANQAFAGPEIDLAKKYAQVGKTLMFTFFYAYLLPVGTVLSAGSFLFIYAVDKILLLRRDSKPPQTGSELAEEMVDFYGEFILLIYSIGCVVWEEILFDTVFGLTWAQLGLTLLNFLAPIDMLFDKYFKVEEESTQVTYDVAYVNFWDDYDRRNPITQDKAIEEWMEYQAKHENKDDKMKGQQKIVKKFAEDVQKKKLGKSHKKTKKDKKTD